MKRGKPKSKMGRPPLPPGEAKIVFTVRITNSERELIESAAARAGKRVTQWARDTLLDRAGNWTSQGGR